MLKYLVKPVLNSVSKTFTGHGIEDVLNLVNTSSQSVFHSALALRKESDRKAIMKMKDAYDRRHRQMERNSLPPMLYPKTKQERVTLDQYNIAARDLFNEAPGTLSNDEFRRKEDLLLIEEGKKRGIKFRLLDRESQLEGLYQYRKYKYALAALRQIDDLLNPSMETWAQYAKEIRFRKKMKKFGIDIKEKPVTQIKIPEILFPVVCADSEEEVFYQMHQNNNRFYKKEENLGEAIFGKKEAIIKTSKDMTDKELLFKLGFSDEEDWVETYGIGSDNITGTENEYDYVMSILMNEETQRHDNMEEVMFHVKRRLDDYEALYGPLQGHPRTKSKYLPTLGVYLDSEKTDRIRKKEDIYFDRNGNAFPPYTEYEGNYKYQTPSEDLYMRQSRYGNILPDRYDAEYLYPQSNDIDSYERTMYNKASRRIEDEMREEMRNMDIDPRVLRQYIEENNPSDDPEEKYSLYPKKRGSRSKKSNGVYRSNRNHSEGISQEDLNVAYNLIENGNYSEALSMAARIKDHDSFMDTVKPSSSRGIFYDFMTGNFNPFGNDIYNKEVLDYDPFGEDDIRDRDTSRKFHIDENDGEVYVPGYHKGHYDPENVIYDKETDRFRKRSELSEIKLKSGPFDYESSIKNPFDPFGDGDDGTAYYDTGHRLIPREEDNEYRVQMLKWMHPNASNEELNRIARKMDRDAELYDRYPSDNGSEYIDPKNSYKSQYNPTGRFEPSLGYDDSDSGEYDMSWKETWNKPIRAGRPPNSADFDDTKFEQTYYRGPSTRGPGIDFSKLPEEPYRAPAPHVPRRTSKWDRYDDPDIRELLNKKDNIEYDQILMTGDIGFKDVNEAKSYLKPRFIDHLKTFEAICTNDLDKIYELHL